MWGLAFAHFLRDDTLDVLAELLADRERVARFAAAQGIGDLGRRDGAVLPRNELRISDASATSRCELEALF